ncbi:MAG: MOSC domain-containing protein [Pikeienuella sp.]
MATLNQICRHPIKSLGEEVIERVLLTAGAHMPGDRVWAIAHANSAFEAANPTWQRSRNFVIQTLNPKLVQLTVALVGDMVTLTHPDLGAITVSPERDSDALTAWLTPIIDPAIVGPYFVAKGPQPFSDFENTHISIGSTSSLHALEQMADTQLARIRFRMNLWLDDVEPWAEQSWIGKEISIGAARLRIIDPAKRCAATNANPSTGMRDTDLPRLLHSHFGHMNFGVYAQVIEGGEIATNDKVTLP